MKKRCLTILLALMLLVCNLASQSITVSATEPLVRYHVKFDESINEGYLDHLKIELWPLREMIKRMDFDFTANQEFTMTDSIELPMAQVGETTSRTGGTGTMTITGKADLIEGCNYTYSFEGTLTYSSEMQWFDDRTDIPPMQGTDGTIEFQSTGQFRIALTNEETPGKSMFYYGGTQGSETAAQSYRYAINNIKDGSVVEDVRDPDVYFTSLPFYVFTSRHLGDLPTVEENDDNYSFTGTIVDYADRPMKFMEVQITTDGYTFNGTTNETGSYSIKADGLEEFTSNVHD